LNPGNSGAAGQWATSEGSSQHGTSREHRRGHRSTGHQGNIGGVITARDIKGTSDRSSQHGTSGEHRRGHRSTGHQGNIWGAGHQGNIWGAGHQGNIWGAGHLGNIWGVGHLGNIWGAGHQGTGVPCYVEEDSRRGIEENMSISVGSLGVRQIMNCFCTSGENLLLPRAMSLTVL